MKHLHEKLKAELAKYINQKNSSKLKDEIRLKTQKMLVQLEGELHYGQEVETDMLWGTMSFKEKTMWFVANRIFPAIGRDMRQTVDMINKERRMNSELVRTEKDEEGEELDCEMVRLLVEIKRAV